MQMINFTFSSDAEMMEWWRRLREKGETIDFVRTGRFERIPVNADDFRRDFVGHTFPTFIEVYGVQFDIGFIHEGLWGNSSGITRLML